MALPAAGAIPISQYRLPGSAGLVFIFYVAVSLTTTKAWVVDITPGASGNSIQLQGGWAERVA